MRLDMSAEDAALLAEAVGVLQHRILESLTDTDERARRESLKRQFERLSALRDAFDLGWAQSVAFDVEPMHPVEDRSVELR